MIQPGPIASLKVQSVHQLNRRAVLCATISGPSHSILIAGLISPMPATLAIIQGSVLTLTTTMVLREIGTILATEAAMVRTCPRLRVGSEEFDIL